MTCIIQKKELYKNAAEKVDQYLLEYDIAIDVLKRYPEALREFKREVKINSTLGGGPSTAKLTDQVVNSNEYTQQYK